MIEWVREWIIGITTVSVLLSAAKALIPKGSIKQVGEFACGLLLFLAISAAVLKLDAGEMSLALTELRLAESGSTQLMEIENINLVKEIIAEKTAAYISDKATELGMDCTVEVTYQYSDDGMAYPESVRIKGAWDHTQQQALSDFIESNLAVSKDNQTYEREQDP
jgi:stage III sporulation protein AF